MKHFTVACWINYGWTTSKQSYNLCLALKTPHRWWSHIWWASMAPRVSICCFRKRIVASLRVWLCNRLLCHQEKKCAKVNTLSEVLPIWSYRVEASCWKICEKARSPKSFKEGSHTPASSNELSCAWLGNTVGAAVAKQHKASGKNDGAVQTEARWNTQYDSEIWGNTNATNCLSSCNA